MDAEQYRKNGKELVDRIADYLTNIREQSVLPTGNLKPGFLRAQLPAQAPVQPEPWDSVKRDMENIILPAATHWQSPHMHAFFPALNSFPSLMGDMWADAINCLGFTWEASPICTELEIVAMDWLCQALGLPEKFLHSSAESSKGGGGGVILSTCSEATLTAMMAARKRAIDHQKLLPLSRTLSEADILSRLVAYTSNQAHSSVEKAGMLCMVKMRHLPVDPGTLALNGETLREAMEEDRAKGLIPFFVCATLGTTGCCAFDDLWSVGAAVAAAADEADGAGGVWLHVDAAYAGTAFLCPEYRHLLAGVRHANSFCFNPSKWMMVHFDCTAFWVDNRDALEQTFSIDPVYLSHKYSGQAVDFMHWQIPLSRRFRALKLWYVMRCFGISGLQDHVRRGVELAGFFEQLVKSNKAFEVRFKRHLGLVVFSLKENNQLTKALLREILKSRKLYVVPADLNGVQVIRFTVTSPHTTEEDIRQAWQLIENFGMKVLGDDYVKCMVGECSSCGPKINIISTDSPPSELSNSEEEEEGSHLGEKYNPCSLLDDDDDASERRTEGSGTPCSGDWEIHGAAQRSTPLRPITGELSDDERMTEKSTRKWSDDIKRSTPVDNLELSVTRALSSLSTQ